MKNEVERLLTLLGNIESGVQPRATNRPSINDNYIARLICQTARDEGGLRVLVTGSEAFLEWINAHSDEQLLYFLWLARKHIPA